MTEPAIEGDRKESRRRWHCWWIALLVVALVAGATLCRAIGTGDVAGSRRPSAEEELLWTLLESPL
jgi:hypothetical protein